MILEVIAFVFIFILVLIIANTLIMKKTPKVGRGEPKKKTKKVKVKEPKTVKLSILQSDEYKKSIDSLYRIKTEIANEYWQADMERIAKKQETKPKPKQKLRVLTYNVHMGKDPMNRENTSADIISIINEIDADVICLQEFDHKSPLGIYLYDNYDYILKCDTNEKISNAIFSKYPIHDEVCFRISDNRVCAKVTIGKNSQKPISIYNVHLTVGCGVANGEDDRIAELNKLAELMDSDDGPKILLGDFNAPYPTKTNGGDKKLHKMLADAKFKNVFPSGGPDIGATSMYGHIVDFIYYIMPSNNKVIAAYYPSGASDHIPIYADFENAII